MDPKSPPNLPQTTAIGGLNKKFSEPWRIEGVKLINGDVLVDPLLKNCERSKLKRCLNDKDHSSKRRCLESAKDAVFYKPWWDSIGDDKDLSASYPSQDVVAALTLIHFSNGTQLQTQTQPQMQPKIESYDCNVCGKEFTSYYALGGHMTIHRVKPPQPLLENRITNAVEKTRRPKMPPSGKIHKCPICHILFPTGQALGGHKRRHYKGEKRNHSEEVTLSSDGESVGDKSSQNNESVVTKVLETEERQRSLILIDLNEPPLPEIEETTA